MASIHIVKFIQSLDDAEIKVIDDYIQSNYLLSKFHSTENSKQLKLFRYITCNKNKRITDAELIKHVNTVNLASLKYLLAEKIYDALLLTKHIQNKKTFASKEQIILTLKKKSLLIKILYATQNQERIGTIKIILNELIKQAKEYEVYDVLIEALIIHKQLMGIRYGIAAYEKINKQIIVYDNCFKAIQKVTDTYYQLLLNTEFVSTLNNAQLKEQLTNSIKQAQLDYKATKAQEINYYIHLLKMTLYEHEQEYKHAILFCKKIIVMLKKSKVLFDKERIGVALRNLGTFTIYSGNFKKAVAYFKNAQKYHTNNNLNFLISKEQEFYGLWYSNNYKEAIKCNTEMLQHSTIDLGNYRKSKFIYYQACAFFITKNYKEALQLLNKSFEIEKDKKGWNIALRILTIMVFIELSKINEASRSLEALRKYIERLVKHNEITERAASIIKLLREIEKDGFCYNPENSIATAILEKLSKKQQSASWRYFTPELIPFHEWVKNTVQKQ